ncbi:nucleotide-diphospho-sugar transferase [Mucilaginibacter sabulilitoris]|uniref:Nucleotide-diphospho-sugar transferase n=1 Tax=Mucilaginibacter sabulilitoris TaxID=1173583 RepID=A0ABZ0TGD2_9SPHI|nr:nucleotide-diphospho-sugar transferase [Mucilaginibacter sabulilitoris]WPU91641.1 nucleotide-diphospho-sugar transferase [Mucilaginibacter sabulilitoris]
MFKTPILLLIFNRPDTTEKVFNEIRRLQPAALYIAADGPREGKTEDIERCKKCREIVMNNLDWDCEVNTLFNDTNLGCGAAPASAISWFFEHVERGIILEDDILPDPSFFNFCQEMLIRYENTPDVMHISGCYFLQDFLPADQEQSYYFTRHIHVWGWATWRRAWQYYDYDMAEWDRFNSDEALSDYYGPYYIFWKTLFANMLHKGNDIWDYQWMFAIYKKNGVAINPAANLVQNLGFGENATHTTDSESIYTRVRLQTISELAHTPMKSIDLKKDSLYYQHYLHFDLQAEHNKQKALWKFINRLRKLKARFQKG